MKKSSWALGASVGMAFSLLAGGVMADQSTPNVRTPTTGSVKAPDKPAVEESLPSKAPAATRTENTGATDQSKTVKSLNNKEKDKVETEGK
jgi:hypothetical protein